MRIPLFLIVIVLALDAPASARWNRHTIDKSSRGADGVRLADANGDGLMDIATGWEEGGVIRVYINPGPSKASHLWPRVTVGKVASPEDAVLVDLDGDGALDVVSCCEGRNRTVYVHWAPKDGKDYLDGDAWQTQPVPATKGRQPWMYALPMQIDDRAGIDLVLGSKGKRATIGWLEAPTKPRDLVAWKFHKLYDAGWIMSLLPHDVDGDGDLDVVASDRYGSNAGALWIERPSAEAVKRADQWPVHRIGADGRQVLFLTCGDLDADGLTDVLTATREGVMIFMRRASREQVQWREHVITNPNRMPRGKSVAIGDINLDGKPDIAHSSHTAGNRKTPGVVWMSYDGAPTNGDWDVHDISGPKGVKFDLIELIDLDNDGDLDLLTCEERDNLGVFWYENPLK